MRKDALAFISPYRGAAFLTETSVGTVTVNSDETITDNVFLVLLRNDIIFLCNI